MKNSKMQKPLNLEEIVSHYGNIAKNISNTQSVQPELILAIIKQESSGVAFTHRYEPAYDYLYMPLRYSQELHITMTSEVEAQKTSWGLMQIMGGVARELGFEDYMPALCIPATNINFGARKLSQLLNKYASLTASIASYNAGSPRKTPQGSYVNQEYVDHVVSYMRQIKLILK